MGGGASQLHTTVQEYHDIKEVSLSELSADVFTSPSVQVRCSEVGIFLLKALNSMPLPRHHLNF